MGRGGNKSVKKFLKNILRNMGVDVTRYTPKGWESCVSLKPEIGNGKSVLLSLWVAPFLLKHGEPIPDTHTHNWESLQIARTFLNLGYEVDVVDYRNTSFVPSKKYAIFVAFRTNFERLAKYLDRHCIKVVHLDTAHWLFNNAASLRRSLELQQRKGKTIDGLRIVEMNRAIEYADYATVLGNRFTLNTYRYAGKPLFPIPISVCAVYPWDKNKDFKTCRNSFLWFSSGGLVHKGLDLVLEAFVGMPDKYLTICGQIENDREFISLYYDELYRTKNINIIGPVDFNSPVFLNILSSNVGLIYPSCSEGQCGAVVQAMHGGLIPIISYESGVDVNPSYGIILKECTVDEIRKSVVKISELPPATLQDMSRKAWEFVRDHHTRERFAKEYFSAMEKVFSRETGVPNTGITKEERQLGADAI